MSKVGEYDGTCNRQSSCNNSHATWFNNSTRKYYCRECAYLINQANPEWLREYGEKICVERKPDVLPTKQEKKE